MEARRASQGAAAFAQAAFGDLLVMDALINCLLSLYLFLDQFPIGGRPAGRPGEHDAGAGRAEPAATVDQRNARAPEERRLR